jgi:hypothetical protein
MSKPSRCIFYFILIPAAFFAVVAACVPQAAAERPGLRQEDTSIIALIPEPVAEAEPQAVSQLVLRSGNDWIAGIPGFGENALSAFTGEYSIPGKTGTVKIWLTREYLYYDGWASRSSITSHTVLQKMGNEGRVVAAALGNALTLIVLLPQGTEVSSEEEDRLIMILISQFTGQGQNLFLPAMIPY